MAAISEELHQFIRNTFGSVWALELLLLICREPARAWSADDLNRELRGSLALVVDILARFKHARLVREEGEGRFRYQPESAELKRLVKELEAAYSERPLAVLKVIVTAPHDKIQTFADAFKVKKD